MVETVAYTYTSQTEIERIWSASAALLRTDDDADSVAETDVWDDIVLEATDHWNLYAENRYDPADMTNNKFVRRQCSYLGCYFLSLRRGDPGQYHTTFERITRVLEGIRDGVFQIPRLATRDDYTPAMSNHVIDDRFHIAKDRVQPSISTGGSDSSQHVDPSTPFEPLG